MEKDVTKIRTQIKEAIIVTTGATILQARQTIEKDACMLLTKKLQDSNFILPQPLEKYLQDAGILNVLGIPEDPYSLAVCLERFTGHLESHRWANSHDNIWFLSANKVVIGSLLADIAQKTKYPVGIALLQKIANSNFEIRPDVKKMLQNCLILDEDGNIISPQLVNCGLMSSEAQSLVESAMENIPDYSALENLKNEETAKSTGASSTVINDSKTEKHK